jgi:two-component system, cell cycle sensor histidine kinase and response regulator CckA
VEESVGFCLSGSPVDYELAFADDLCDVAVDRGQLDQALSSVVTNAVEAMDNHGTIRIRAEVRTVGPRPVLPIREGVYAVIAVTDEGPGIPEHHIHRVFDPYFTTKMDHSGLGLTTAYSILANHDGCIDVESRLGAGATFSLYLPAAPGEAAAEHGPDEETAEEESARGKVLLMEESEFTRNSLAKLVEHLGYQCEAVDGSQAAVHAFQEARASHSPFDAVILNLTMKHGAGGKQTLDDLRHVDPGVKAIVTSGLSSDPVMAAYEEHGFRAALVKPYGASQLEAALQKVMKKG